MRYDDERLECALRALPLEEAPPDLHARILAVTIHRPAPVFRSWELWVVGTALAVATWLVLAVTGNALAGGPGTAVALQTAIDRAVETLGGAVTPSALLWAGLGIIAAVWFSQLTIPGNGESSEA